MGIEKKLNLDIEIKAENVLDEKELLRLSHLQRVEEEKQVRKIFEEKRQIWN